MNQPPHVVSTKEGVFRTIHHPISRITATRPGELLSMSDGSVWFHPYDGSAPVQETAAGVKS